MNHALRQLILCRGTSSRKQYVFVGLVAFAAKYNLDRLIVWKFFHEPWHITNYLLRSVSLISNPATHTDFRIALVMIVLAGPFIWLGVSLTLRRLRDCGLPQWLVVFFFAPVLNLLFFALLSLLPSKSSDTNDFEDTNRPPRLLVRWLPKSKWANAWLAVLISVVISVASIGISTTILSDYGFGLFVGLPFCQALLAVLLYGVHGPQSLRECMSVGLATCVITGGCLLVFAFEGAICLVMAAPIALVLAAFGSCIGYLILLCCRPSQEVYSSIALIAIYPVFLMLVESRIPTPAPVFSITSSIEIAAAPEKVWRNVVAFTELPQPKEWLFRAGIAYPIRAEIHGHGVGAERHCVFSTGAFIEPITVWDQPNLLKFQVTSNPAPLEEWTPYHEVHPPHLDGFLQSQGGQFNLIELEGNRTRIEGTTWYQHHLWPANYWRWWSDYIIHRIHIRVLSHIKKESETRMIN